MQGISVELNELIDLRRFASKPQYKPKGQGVRSGAWQSVIRGRGMDFAEVRNYQAGDEVRHMEWRVTARTGKPHVKLYQEERERPVILLTDFNPSMYFGTRIAFKSVIAARLAALIAWTAIKEGDRVGGLIFSGQKHQEYLPRGREYGVLPYLSGLCEYSQQKPAILDDTTPLSAMLMRSRRVIRPGSTLVIISDCYQLDSDSELEIVVPGYSSSGKKIYAINHDGTEVSGFPVDVGERMIVGVALHDFNNNGKDDIVFGSDSDNIHLMHDDGTIVWTYETGDKIQSAPSIINTGNGILICETDDIYNASDKDNHSRGKWEFLEGEEMSVEVEGFSRGDRTSLDLPKNQVELMKAVVATGKPVVLLLINGSALSINYAKGNVD